MPSAFYGVFTPRDLDAVVAYLRSVPPIQHEVEVPSYKADLPVDPYPGGEVAMSEEELNDPVRRGFYLTTIGHCMECHTPRSGEQHDFTNALGKGGEVFTGPFGTSVSANITSHRTAGIGAWSDAEIKTAITEGISRDGRRLKPPMLFAAYRRMSERDLDAVVAWLRTLPALE
jgi:mono/diheme cytochrome c family protein